MYRHVLPASISKGTLKARQHVDEPDVWLTSPDPPKEQKYYKAQFRTLVTKSKITYKMDPVLKTK